MLSAKYNIPMSSIQKMAQSLGRLGGIARAKRLSEDHRKKIAAHGGKARAESLLAARRIRANFEYLATVKILAGKPTIIKSVSNYKGPLPGHYAKTR